MNLPDPTPPAKEWEELGATDTLRRGDRVLFLAYPLSDKFLSGTVESFAPDGRVVVRDGTIYQAVPQPQVVLRARRPRRPAEDDQSQAPGPRAIIFFITAFVVLVALLALMLWAFTR